MFSRRSIAITCVLSLYFGLVIVEAATLALLSGFDFLHHFFEGGMAASSIFTNDSELLGACYLSLWPRLRLQSLLTSVLYHVQLGLSVIGVTCHICHA